MCLQEVCTGNGRYMSKIIHCTMRVVNNLRGTDGHTMYNPVTALSAIATAALVLEMVGEG